MSLDLVLLIAAATVVVAMAINLLRLPVRQAWDGWVLLAVPVLVSAAIHYAVGARAGVAFWVTFVALTLAPVWALRASGRALRWGRVARARRYARIGWLLRPFGGAARFRHTIELAWRIDQGEDFDLEAEVDRLGVLPGDDRAVQLVALWSWRPDFDRMAAAMADPKALLLMTRVGMTSLVLTALGEKLPPKELAEIYQGFIERKRDTVDAGRALLVGAAYLGRREVVDQMVEELEREAPPERSAFWLATVEQRRGNAEEAKRIIDDAYRRHPKMSAGSRRRLEHRLGRPLGPIDASDATIATTCRAIEETAYARRALGALSLRRRRGAPATWILTATLVVGFIVQLLVARNGDEAAISAGALFVPFETAPDIYRLLTHAWLHADGVHLGVNVIGLVFFGRFVEQHLRVARTVVVYVASALGGSALLLLLRSQPAAAVGASGAIFGLIGATFILVALDRTLRRTRQGRREIAVLVFIALAQLVADTLLPFSAGSAHLGGLLTGLVVTMALGPKLAVADDGENPERGG